MQLIQKVALLVKYAKQLDPYSYSNFIFFLVELRKML